MWFRIMIEESQGVKAVQRTRHLTQDEGEGKGPEKASPRGGLFEFSSEG